MAIFVYKGLDKTGREIKSTLNSESMSLAKSKVKGQGIMLIEIKEQKSNKEQKGSISFGGAVSIEDLGLMTRQLATLVRAKIQIVEAFSALMDQTDNPKLKVILSEVKQKVNEGMSLSAALGQYPKVFNNVYVNMVEAGEQSGTLEVVLLKLADFTEAQMKLKSKIKSALTYPMIMVFVGVIMFGIIFSFVIPKLAKVFTATKKELPWMTKVCINLSDFTRSYWWLVLIVSVFSYIVIKKYVHSKSGERRWHRVILKLPILGTLVTMINVSRFSSTLATLLQSGVPILTAMGIVKNLIANVHMAEAVEQSRTQISEGAPMCGPLVKSGLFPSLVTHMITLGERSGELEPMLNIVAENYEDQVENKLAGLTATLEPIMMIVMGGAVGFVVFAVVMPMLELNSVK